jgi:putative ABC transport system permease protein
MTGSSTVVPTWIAVGVSFSLVLIAAGIAWRERLGISRDVLVAAVRAFVQLVGVGLILAWLFANAGVPGAVLWVCVMVVIASFEAGRRGRGLPQARIAALAGIAAGTAVTLGVLVAGRVIDSAPQVLIPIGGMVVSGAMQASSLVLRDVRRSAEDDRREVEAALSLGLSARASFEPQARRAVRGALVPAIDTTRVVGLISLPGAMTGLILAGVAPLEAIRYQIVVMYMLLAAWAVSALATERLAERWLFDDAERMQPVVVA